MCSNSEGSLYGMKVTEKMSPSGSSLSRLELALICDGFENELPHESGEMDSYMLGALDWYIHINDHVSVEVMLLNKSELFSVLYESGVRDGVFTDNKIDGSWDLDIP